MTQPGPHYTALRSQPKFSTTVSAKFPALSIVSWRWEKNSEPNELVSFNIKNILKNRETECGWGKGSLNLKRQKSQFKQSAKSK